MRARFQSWASLAWVIAILFLCCPPLLRAQGTSSTLTLEGRLFRIGYLRREVTGHVPGERLTMLREQLLADKGFASALKANNYADIGLFPCDGAADMTRRLNAREFDVAFTPASVYAQQRGGYVAFLKSRRPSDFISPNGLVLRYGVVIVSPRNPLFAMKDPSTEQIREALQSQRLALVRTQSVAGFNAPLLAMASQYGVKQGDVGYVWYESSEEVVKAVVSGLTDVGACERSALDTAFDQWGLAAGRDRLVRVLLTTDPVPTDPVVVRAEFGPRASELGRALREAIVARFDGRESPLRYLAAEDDDFRAVRELLGEFDRKLGEVRP